MFKVDLTQKKPEWFEEAAVWAMYEEVIEPAIKETSDSYGVDLDIEAYDLRSALHDPGNEILMMFTVAQAPYADWMDEGYRLEDDEAWYALAFEDKPLEELRSFLKELTVKSGIEGGDHYVGVEAVFCTNNVIVIMVAMMK